jgi:cytochrome c-type biogenesis protein CcmF
MTTLYFLYPITYTKQGPGFLIAIYLALFACIYSVITNGAYIWIVIKGNIKSAGSALAHVGFTLMIAGMLISSANKKVISDNRKTGLYIPFAPDPDGKHTEDPLENLTLLRTVPTEMLDYTLTYVKDSGASEKNRTFFTLLVQRKDSVTGSVKENFKLRPDVYLMKDNNISSNPDIKHYLFHDVFTYISSLPDKNAVIDTASFHITEIGVGDTAFYQKGYAVLNNVLRNPKDDRFNFNASDTALVADITVASKDNSIYRSYPQLAVNNLEIVYKDDTVFAQNVITRLAGITEKGKFKIAIKVSELPADFVTLKAYVFPFINFVWLGLIVMAAGFVLSILNKVKAGKVIYLAALLFVTGILFYMFLVAN